MTDGVAVFCKASSRDSPQVPRKILNVRDAMMTCAIYGTRKGRALAITNGGLPWKKAERAGINAAENNWKK